MATGNVASSRPKPVAASLKVVLCLAGPPQPALKAALQQAGHSLLDVAAPELPQMHALVAAADVVIVDCGALAEPAANRNVADLAQQLPVVLIAGEAACGPATLGMELPAAALLLHPIDTASLLASLPLWVQRKREFTALRAAEAELLGALQTSRRISSAVGMLAERHGLSVNEAFNQLRQRARARRQRTEDLAQAIVAGEDGTS